MPISVIPICTVDKNLSGLPDRSKAFCAALLPFFASVDRRDFRAEIMATSDIENTQFNKINPIIIKISLILLFPSIIYNYLFLSSVSIEMEFDVLRMSWLLLE